MNLITPIVLIIISIGTFVFYIDPGYRGQDLTGVDRSVQSLQQELAEYQKASNNAETVRSKRQSLQDTKNSFSLADLSKLQYLLPDNIDNIKLIIDMNNIASKHSLVLKGAKLDTGDTNTNKNESTKIGLDNKKYGTVKISFSVSSTYSNFQDFLKDLERSLRLVDITDLSVNGSDNGIYDFSVSLNTYWLK
jgi:Tfp pilus assembly protein PilO